MHLDPITDIRFSLPTAESDHTWPGHQWSNSISIADSQVGHECLFLIRFGLSYFIIRWPYLFKHKKVSYAMASIIFSLIRRQEFAQEKFYLISINTYNCLFKNLLSSMFFGAGRIKMWITRYNCVWMKAVENHKFISPRPLDIILFWWFFFPLNSSNNFFFFFKKREKPRPKPKVRVRLRSTL